ncbi:hypothetical protein GQ44DRAFT_630921, partial [Phaeosphaeriaceae sp. PMI808]
MPSNEQYPSTQRHHYIPQFILRRFAIPSIAPKNEKKRPQRPKAKDVVNTADLTQEVPTINTAFTKQIFQKQDMYRDDSETGSKKQMHMERKLGDIEREA